jgi:hypothetical protein
VEKYGLSSDFELDSYFNLVPTCSTCNNRKRAKPYDKITILFYLNEIRVKISLIEKLESKYRVENLEGELSATVSKILNESSMSDVLNLLNDFNLTSLEHRVLSEAFQRLSPISTLTPKENQQLQLFIDEVNRILRDFIPLNRLFTVKGNRFIDNKAGIVIVDEWAGSVTYSLYAVPNTATDIIREISKEQWFNLAHRRLFEARTTDVKKTLLEYPKREAGRNILEYFADLISVNAVYNSLDEFIINEFIIDFIDFYHIPLGLEVKNEYKIEEIAFAFNIYLPIWLDEVINRANKKMIQKMVLNRGYVDVGALDTFFRAYKKEIEESVKNRMLKDGNLSKDTKKIPFACEKFPIHIFMKYLMCSQNKNIKKINRIYEKPDYTREEFKKTHYVFDLYSKETTKVNLKIVNSNLITVYDNVVQQILPQIKDFLIPFTDSTKLIIEFKENERILVGDPPFSQYTYYLKGKEEEKFEIVFFSEISDSIPDEVRTDKTKKLTFRNKDYEVDMYSNGIIIDIYKPLVMFNIVKEKLSERLLDLFMKEHKKIISKLIE